MREHPPSSPECVPIWRRLLVRHSLVALEWHPSLLLPSFVTQTSLVQWILHRLQSRLCLLYFCNLGSDSAFLRWQMSINVAKWTCFFVSLCIQNKSLFSLNFVQMPRWNRFEPLSVLVHCCFRIRNFHRLTHRNKLVHHIATGHRSKAFSGNAVFKIFGLLADSQARYSRRTRGDHLSRQTPYQCPRSRTATRSAFLLALT